VSKRCGGEEGGGDIGGSTQEYKDDEGTRQRE
jgi:hypothetical protein